MQRRTLPLLAAVFAFTWIPQLPAVLARHGLVAGPAERYFPLLAVASLGPLLAAVAITFEEERGAGVRALFRQLRVPTVPLAWQLVALVGPGILVALATLCARIVGLPGAARLVHPPSDAPSVVALVVFPLSEELAWRGLALPRLAQRHGVVGASARVGVAWAVWHALMFDLSGYHPLTVVVSVPFFVAGSVVYAWAWLRTGRSLWVAVLLHVGAHLNNASRPLPGNVTPALASTVGYVLLALALVALDRETFRHAPMEG